MKFSDAIKSMDYNKIWQYFNEMDYKSQEDTYKYYKIITVVFSIIFFIIGFIFESYQITNIGNTIIMLINIILFVPGWPIWKKNGKTFLKDDKKTK